jgi:hypothetical protein
MKKFLLLLLLILSSLQADIIIFGASKDENIRDKNIEKFQLEISKNIELLNLQDEDKLQYSKEKFGEFFVISINSRYSQQILILLRPIFKDIFKIQSKQKKLSHQENKNIIDNIFRYILFIDKSYIILIIALLSFIFLYIRFRKLKEIKYLQNNFKNNQDILQDKIDNLI